MQNYLLQIKTRFVKLTNLQTTLILSLTYLLFRLANLRILPIFNDEATYLDWGWRMVNLDGEGFHSVLHAKTPFLMWIFGYSENIFTDPLIAGRVVSVLFGLGAAIGIFFLSKDIFGKKTALLAYILYLLNPLFSFYDRQALMEAAISAIGIWSFYLYFKLKKNDNYLVAAGLGIHLGLGYFIKSNALTFALTVGFLGTYKLIKERELRQDKFLISLAVVFSTAFIVLTPLIFNSIFWETLEQNQKYILTPSQLTRFPITLWLKNLFGTVHISLIYLNPVLVISSIYASYLVVKEKNIHKITLILWIVIGLGITNFLAKGSSLRYVVSFLPLILVPGSYGIVKIIKKNIAVGIVSLIILMPTFFLSILQLYDPIKYFNTLDKLSPKYSEKYHYVTGWPSGYGINETVKHLTLISEETPLVVGVRLDAGNPENAIFTYFYESKKIKPTYLDSQMFSPELLSFDCIETSIPLYFVSRDGNTTGLNKYFEEVERFYKPEEINFIGIHKLKTNCEGTTVKLF